MARDFSNKVAFITGAAHGQGRAVALAFARAGAAVAGFDIARSLTYPAYPLGSNADLETLRTEIEGLDGRFLPLVGDVREEAAVAARGGGVIIFNSSVAGLRGFPRLAHYAASKWGLVGLAKSLAIEVAQANVRVVTLHPTGVDTPLNDGLALLEGSTAPEVAEKSAGNLLPTPWVTVDDVVASVLFLASEDARFITGSALVLDAGLMTR